MNDLTVYLEDLEERIDADVEDDLYDQWSQFWNETCNYDFFVPKRKKRTPSQIEWPDVTVNEAIEDYDKMVLQQFKNCSDSLAVGNGSPLMVRANYGTGILPLLFGTELFLMGIDLDTLPTCRPLNDIGKIRTIVRKGVPEIDAGYSERVFEMGIIFKDIKDKYPKTGKHLHVYHPDLQGPFDVCEVVWGGDIFYALVDEPSLVKDLLEVVTETYVLFMRKWEQIIPFKPDLNPHWGALHRGTVTLRDDSAVNLSGDFFDEFIRPYDQRLLDEFDGGMCHFCGRGDHFIDRMCGMKGVYAVAMGQPECNDMEKIYKQTVDTGIKLIGLRREAADEAARNNRPLRGQSQTFPP